MRSNVKYLSSEIIHSLFVACDHLIVLAYIISEPAGLNVCHSLEVEPAFGTSSAYFCSPFQPPTPHPPSLCHCFQLFTFPFFHSYGLLEQSFGKAVQIRLWCQNRASLLHTFGLLVSPGAKVTRGPAGQLVPIASRGLFFWGPPSQPGCSDVRRAGYQPPGNVQAVTHRGNRRRAQMHTTPSRSF